MGRHAPDIVPTPVTTLPDGSLDPTVELTFTQAAFLCGVSVPLVRRRHIAGAFPNARHRPGDAHRRWVVPIGDLAAAELLDRSQLGDPAAKMPADVAADAVEIARLKAENVGLREAYEARGTALQTQAEALAVYRQLLGERGGAA